MTLAHSLRISGDVSFHRVEQVECIGVIGPGFSGDAHHQHEVKEAVRGVARRPEALERDFP
jgi:hypothetical protein